MRAAVITPWPGEHSGIADYCYDLVGGLSKLGAEVTVFTTSESPKPLADVNIVNVEFQSWDLSLFDIRVFHFGNNFEFHFHMLDLLKKYGGVVHLHDYVLHHLIAGMAQHSKGWEWYFDRLNDYYGEVVAANVKQDWERGKCVWESDNILELPFNDEVIFHADAIITHSQFAKNKIIEKYQTKSVSYIEQVYDMTKIKEKNHTDFTFGVFGHVQPNKCIDQLLDALSVIEPQDCKFEVRVAGKVADKAYYKSLLDKLESVDEYVSLTVLGYLEEHEFLTEIISSDVVVALRNPTMGETSAIAMRAMQLCKPLVVTDIGWYSELPDIVCKVESSNNGIIQIANFVQEMINDSHQLVRLQKELEVYSNKHLSFTKVCEKYLFVLYTISQPDFLSDLQGGAHLIATKLYELGLTKEDAHKPHRTFIYEKLAPFFNGD